MRLSSLYYLDVYGSKLGAYDHRKCIGPNGLKVKEKLKLFLFESREVAVEANINNQS